MSPIWAFKHSIQRNTSRSTQKGKMTDLIEAKAIVMALIARLMEHAVVATASRFHLEPKTKNNS